MRPHQDSDLYPETPKKGYFCPPELLFNALLWVLKESFRQWQLTLIYNLPSG